MAEARPTVFSLLTGLTARQRQEFAAERRRRAARQGVREELIQDRKGRWAFVYFFGKRKFDALPFPQAHRRPPRP